MDSIYKYVHDAQTGQRKAALCTVVKTSGSTPRKVGAKMIVYADGRIRGTIGGGELEKAVIQNALRQIEVRVPKLFRHDLVHQHNMCCGGSVDIFIEPIMNPIKLYIFGAGHTGLALAALAQQFPFSTVLIDERKQYLEQCTTDGVSKMCLPYAQAVQLLPFDADTYVCIMTHSHEYDRDILAACISKPHGYLGMIGSQRKVELTKKMFADAGIASETLANAIDMPMGLYIGAEGPEEIALSIIAKLIAVKNGVNATAALHGKKN
ncbi:MAG: xanthine dehydrogenase accessory protein XdhC [Chlorobi bacterium]|nr:MAG: xanthine dehydrogenase accessory protein XdhC [Bacteroidota bacterium]MBE2265989.1 XdhC family protein [Flavobacteriales bacterium]MBL1161431.1 xanthine dehydrogenase accessory protein XdhC [Chlorobiota bacterium]MBW7854012.1 XdhC family protein [Candidatus Kapabacteria bacterium]MCC6331897.1 XdhC family protein [Ignavibacteria bacterium]